MARVRVKQQGLDHAGVQIPSSESRTNKAVPKYSIKGYCLLSWFVAQRVEPVTGPLFHGRPITNQTPPAAEPVLPPFAFSFSFSFSFLFFLPVRCTPTMLMIHGLLRSSSSSVFLLFSESVRTRPEVGMREPAQPTTTHLLPFCALIRQLGPFTDMGTLDFETSRAPSMELKA